MRWLRRSTRRSSGEFMGQMVGHMTGGALCFGMWLGDELGLYRALAGAGAMSADDVAGKTGCNPRLVREWLDGQAAGGLIGYDIDTDRYELSPEAEWALADDSSPAFVARAMNAFGSMFIDIDKITDRLPRRRRAELGRPPPVPVLGHRVVLPHRLPGRAAELDRRPRRRGRQARRRRHRRRRRLRPRRLGRRAGRRPSRTPTSTASTSTRPRSRRHGSGPRRRACRARRPSRSPTPRATSGTYDLICFFDCLHDMGDPVGIAALRPRATSPTAARCCSSSRSPSTTAHSNLTENPMAALLYTASSCICTPNSLSQEVGLGLGAQAGEARLREVFEQAGLHALPAGGRDAAQPHPRGPRLIEGSAAAALASVRVPTTARRPHRVGATSAVGTSWRRDAPAPLDRTS